MKIVPGCARVPTPGKLGVPTDQGPEEAAVSSEFVGPLERGAERQRTSRRSVRMLVVESLGPLTVLGGAVWAVAQPYRIVFLERAGKGFYDYLVQPPLLVIAVGLVFALGIAPGIVEDLRSDGGPEG